MGCSVFHRTGKSTNKDTRKSSKTIPKMHLKGIKNPLKFDAETKKEKANPKTLFPNSKTPFPNPKTRNPSSETEQLQKIVPGRTGFEFKCFLYISHSAHYVPVFFLFCLVCFVHLLISHLYSCIQKARQP